MEERRPEAGNEGIRFLVDGMLGTLARNLRMLGFDAAYVSGDFLSVLERAVRERRWLLTRRGVDAAAARGVPALRIQHDLPDRQIVQVLRVLPGAADRNRFFSRCIRCNRALLSLPWEDAKERVPDFVAQTQRHFRRCPSCQRVYWSGTHSVRMRRVMDGWITASQEGKDETRTHERESPDRPFGFGGAVSKR
jgi:uncharacterized protein